MNNVSAMSRCTIFFWMALAVLVGFGICGVYDLFVDRDAYSPVVNSYNTNIVIIHTTDTEF